MEFPHDENREWTDYRALAQSIRLQLRQVLFLASSSLLILPDAVVGARGKRMVP
jgi:hypothetical protein